MMIATIARPPVGGGATAYRSQFGCPSCAGWALGVDWSVWAD
jgi:hypothetical protein